MCNNVYSLGLKGYVVCFKILVIGLVINEDMYCQYV